MRTTKSKKILVRKMLSLFIVTAITLSGIFISGKDAAEADAFSNAEWTAFHMGRGINLGNTLEKSGNPKTYDAIKNAVDDFIAQGFTTIRIPMNWGGRSSFTQTRVDGNGNIKTDNADVVTFKRIVDYITKTVNPARVAQGKKEIYVVINAHHEEWSMNEDADLLGGSKYDSNMVKLNNIWSGICDMFKDSPDTLLFELYNEPHLKLEQGTAAKNTVVDMENQMYNTIRNYTYNGSKVHQKRIIIVGGYCWNSAWGLYDTYNTASKLPGGGNDRYLMGTFHYYPELGVTNTTESFDNVVNNFVIKYNTPVYMGEYGYSHNGTINNDVKNFYRNIGNNAIAHNFPFTVWDDNGSFRIYNRGTRTFNQLATEVFGNGNSIHMPDSDVYLVPTNDATLRGGNYADTRYGTATTIEAKNGTGDYARKTYMKFVFDNLYTGSVNTAKIRLYGKNIEDTSTVSAKLYDVSSTNWGESTITWNTAPGNKGDEISSVNVSSAQQYYYFDVTDYINSCIDAGKTTVTILLETDGGKRIQFNSHESSTNRPHLILNY